MTPARVWSQRWRTDRRVRRALAGVSGHASWHTGRD